MTSILDTVIDIGGLLRCCVATIDEIARESPDMVVAHGQRASCKWCDEQIVYTDGAWRWAKPHDRDAHRNLTNGDA